MPEKHARRGEADSQENSITRRRYLTGALGVGATVTAVPFLSTTATAHFPLELDIDIQPDNAANFIDLAEHDTIPVAVHPTEFISSDGDRETFDPTDEPVRYRFGSRETLQDGNGARPVEDATQQAGDDGSEMLVLEFPVADMGFDGAEETGWLYWERNESGEHGYAGVDSVRIYGSDPSNQDLIELLRQLLNTQR